MTLLSQVLFIVRTEAKFLARYPKVLFSALVVVFVPAMYAVIYLSSVWDPQGRTSALPVALVNLDEGVQYKEQLFNLGVEIANRLENGGRFGFHLYSDDQEARALVREGKMAFAVIIPHGFSATAIPGASAGAAKVVIFTSEGNNFESAGIAKQFAEVLGRDVNESLNEQRWALVLRNAAGSQRGVDALREGVAQLRVGSQELATRMGQAQTGASALASGTRALNDGVTQLTTGVKQLGGGLKTLDARRPRNPELNQLTTGAQALVEGHQALGRGLDDLQKGSQHLRDGTLAFRDDAKSSLFVSDKTIQSIDQFADGMTQLDAGIASANSGQDKLADGALRLSGGVEKLVGGVRAMGGAVRTMVNGLPEDARLDELGKGANDVSKGAAALADATQKLSLGAHRLSSGIDLLADSLPKGLEKIDGSAPGLATSVQTLLEIDAPVSNSGSGFASNVIPGALWLGAGLTAFLFHLRLLPRRAQHFSRHAKWMGKVVFPSAVVLLQAAAMFFTVVYFLGVHVNQLGVFALVLCIAALAFLFIVFALTKAFGDAGRGVAMFLLAVQLTSSGGVLPVELSGGWFAQISPWLPLTWVVQSLKASMFGAYGGAWQQPVVWVTLAGLMAGAIACVAGRWRYIRSGSMRPSVY